MARAEPRSHGLGMISGSPGRCSSRNLAVSAGSSCRSRYRPARGRPWASPALRTWASPRRIPAQRGPVPMGTNWPDNAKFPDIRFRGRGPPLKAPVNIRSILFPALNPGPDPAVPVVGGPGARARRGAPGAAGSAPQLTLLSWRKGLSHAG